MNNKLKITILGSGTCQIQKDRMASSVLVEFDDLLKIVFDFGRGASARLSELGLKSDDIKHILLSHLHPDHISDLIPFLHAGTWSRTDPRTAPLNIYGAAGVKSQISKIMDLFPQGDLTNGSFQVHVHEVNDNFKIDNHSFAFIDLPPANNHGLKFAHNNKIIALTGDSNFHKQEVDFLKNSDLAIIDSGHISDDEIIDLAVLSNPAKIVCSHQYRELDQKELNAQAYKRGYKGRIIIANDTMVFEYPI
ncbi:MBL fold metallo-hydrolase [Candidatus Omnitrophota bacterium]